MSNQESSPKDEASNGSTIPGPVEDAFQEFLKYCHNIPLDSPQIDSMRLVYYSSSVYMYNVLMITLKRQPEMIGLISAAIQHDLNTYFGKMDGPATLPPQNAPGSNVLN